MKNMLIRPTQEQLEKDFLETGVDYYIFNAGEMNAPDQPILKGINRKNRCVVSLDFKEKVVTILGSQYAGEMKKGVFSIMNYLMPKKGLHYC